MAVSATGPIASIRGNAAPRSPSGSEADLQRPALTEPDFMVGPLAHSDAGDRSGGSPRSAADAVLRPAQRPPGRAHHQERPLRYRKLAAVVAAWEQMAVGVRRHLDRGVA